MDGAQIEKAIRNAPWWAYAVAGGAGLAGLYYVRQHASGAASASAGAVQATPEYQAPDGLSSADLAGLPFEYYDWSASVDPNASQVPGTDGGTVTTGQVPGPTVYDPNTGTTEGDAGPPPNQRGGSPSGGTSGGSPSNPGPQVYHHTVEAWPAWDSTLSGIAGHYGMSWDQLYHFGNDKAIIDSAAHAHGHFSQEYNWLFPGEVLEVPTAN